MPADSLPLLAVLFLVVGALYSSVGHAGASGYLAVMAFFAVEAAVMRPVALSVNVIVAAIACIQFARAGHFSWRLFWPFAVGSVPAAYLGGLYPLPQPVLKVAIGAVLILSALRMAWVAARPRSSSSAPTLEPAAPPIPIALVVGAALGLVAGLTGTGGGIFLSPLVLIMGWADPKRTAATSALFILVNSLAGLAGVVRGGWSPPTGMSWLVLAAALGGLTGATLGSRFASARTLNALLAAVLAIAGSKLVLQW